MRIVSEAAQPVACRAAVEPWRLQERPFGGDDDGHSGGGLAGSSFKPTVLPDVVVPDEKTRVAWYHRNTRSVYDFCLEVQHLEKLKGSFPDPLLNHTFGASLIGRGFVRSGERELRSPQPAKCHELAVCVLAERAATTDGWLRDLSRVEGGVSTSAKSRDATAAWWKDGCRTATGSI